MAGIDELAPGQNANPRTLTVDTPSPLAPPPPAPTTKDEAKSAVSEAKKRQLDYVATLHEQGQSTKMVNGTLNVWKDAAPPQKPASMSQETWDKYLALNPPDANAGEWVPDLGWQQIQDDIDYAEQLGSELKGSGGAARSALSVEGDKTDEITRQMKDFAYRANLYDSLAADEQKFAMNADDQNMQNLKGQRDLGLASVGMYATPQANTSLSSILRPSLPDYVSPDYRLNAAVGLPGSNGFNDPQYDQNGMPLFAKGTGVRVWRW